MKSMIIGMGLGMAGGMAVASYMLTNPKTKKEASKMIDDAVTTANVAMSDLKKTMRRK